LGAQTLTDQAGGATAPKYVAVKHFFSYVRPDAVRVDATVAGAASLYASAFVHDADGTLTVVLVNAGAAPATAQVQVPAMPAGIASFDGHTSQNGSLWQPSTFMVTSGAISVPVPAYGVVSLQGKGTPVTPPGTGGGSTGGTTAGAGGGSTGAGTGGASGPGAHHGCGCVTAGGAGGGGWMLTALAALAGVLVRRRGAGRLHRSARGAGGTVLRRAPVAWTPPPRDP
jgi:MYXO-CTERM domain-containing protein